MFAYVVWCLVLIHLSLASIKRTPETLWDYKRGGINITWNNKLFRQLIEEKKGIARDFEDSEISDRTVLMKHKKQEIPEFFDARKKWPMCKSLSRIKNQSNCGTCWAVSSTSCVNDRLCISTKETQQFDISEQDIVTCCKECYYNSSISRCDGGGTLVSPLMYMYKYGVVLAECKPYNITTIENGCKHSCSKKTMTYKKHKVGFSSIVIGTVAGRKPPCTLEDVQIEIMKYGPVLTCISRIPDDFYRNYTREVYISTHLNEGEDVHAVKIIGWGTENGIPYWLCANSWGTTWGKLGGYYKIRRGTNELQIEEDYFVTVDTDPKDRPKVTYGGASTISFTKILQKYKITIFVAIAFYI